MKENDTKWQKNAKVCRRKTCRPNSNRPRAKVTLNGVEELRHEIVHHACLSGISIWRRLGVKVLYEKKDIKAAIMQRFHFVLHPAMKSPSPLQHWPTPFSVNSILFKAYCILQCKWCLMFIITMHFLKFGHTLNLWYAAECWKERSLVIKCNLESSVSVSLVLWSQNIR